MEDLCTVVAFFLAGGAQRPQGSGRGGGGQPGPGQTGKSHRTPGSRLGRGHTFEPGKPDGPAVWHSHRRTHGLRTVTPFLYRL